MLIGAGVTVLVQSSSITASALTPLCGIGVLKVEQMFPLILGADIGTTITALLASMVSSNVEALQVALCHVFFNITGASIWYIIPFMRKLPLTIANYLGKITRKWRQFPILLISIMFFLIPLLLLGISACFEKKKKGFTALGVFLLLLMLGAAFYTWIWWRYKGGKQNFSAGVTRRKRRAAAIMGLADDMDYIKVDLEYCKNEIGALKDFAGLIVTESKKHHLVLRPPGSEQHVEPEEERFELPPEERLDDQISLHGSIQSSPWINVLKDAGESIKGSLNAMRL
jgi:sodium-dependent phosphate cotransporter